MLIDVKALIWVTVVAFIAGAIFLFDGVSNWPSGSILEVNAEELRNASSSLSIGSTLVGIGILAGLLTLHARAVGKQTLAALTAHASAERARNDEALRQEHAYRLRIDHRS